MIIRHAEGTTHISCNIEILCCGTKCTLLEVAVSSETFVLVCATTVASQPANRNALVSMGHENKIFRWEAYVILFSVLLPSQDLRTKVSFCLLYVCAQSQVTFEPAESFISFWKKSMHQKGVHCVGVKVFNILPFYIKAEVDNPKKFKAVSQKYLCEYSFYSLDEYFEPHS